MGFNLAIQAGEKNITSYTIFQLSRGMKGHILTFRMQVCVMHQIAYVKISSCLVFPSVVLLFSSGSVAGICSKAVKLSTKCKEGRNWPQKGEKRMLFFHITLV